MKRIGEEMPLAPFSHTLVGKGNEIDFLNKAACYCVLNQAFTVSCANYLTLSSAIRATLLLFLFKGVKLPSFYHKIALVAVTLFSRCCRQNLCNAHITAEAKFSCTVQEHTVWERFSFSADVWFSSGRWARSKQNADCMQIRLRRLEQKRLRFTLVGFFSLHCRLDNRKQQRSSTCCHHQSPERLSRCDVSKGWKAWFAMIGLLKIQARDMLWCHPSRTSGECHPKDPLTAFTYT